MKIRVFILLIFLTIPALLPAAGNEGCTTAIIDSAASSDGAPMLWKNRDTDYLSNKVVYVNETPYSYIALANAEASSGRYAYAGLNSEGFGIMNSVAYNLPKKSGETQDLEGIIMVDALRTCKTVDDFENYIKKNLGPDMGSWANFGVIDAAGNSVIFETHNHGFKKYDVKDTPEKYMINTNFSRSGDPGKGAGYIRFDRATQLFLEIPGKKVSYRYILGTIARDFGHPLVKHPTLDELRTVSEKEQVWIPARDTINRLITSAAVVISGRKAIPEKTGINNIATFWVNLGEPLTSIAVPVWVEAKETPKALSEGNKAPLYAESSRIRNLIHPYTESDKEYYMQLTRLVNKENTGFLPVILKTENEIFEETAQFLKSKKKLTASELASFQDKMAQKAIQTLSTIK